MGSSYAVVWRAENGPTQPGKLEILDHGLRLEGGGQTRVLSDAELASARLGRGTEERLDGRPSLIVQDRDGRLLRISTVGEVGALLELAERLADFRSTGRSTPLTVVVPLKRGSRDAVRALIEHGPPFDPDAAALTRHEVFVTDREAVFVFEAKSGSRVVERLLREPGLWKAAASWRKHLAGPPRIADAIFAWRDEASR
jgi:hypothetical protein